MSVGELLPLIDSLARVAQDGTYAWMVSFSPSELQLVEDMADMVNVYCESAALLAADWYNGQDSDGYFVARPYWNLGEQQRLAIARWVFSGPQLPENQMRAMTHSLVYGAARLTVRKNAELENVAVVRHENADSCGDCRYKATNVVTEKNSKSDYFEDFHHSCTGMYVPVRSGVYEPPEHARSWGEKIAKARLAGNVNADDIANWLEAN